MSIVWHNRHLLLDIVFDYINCNIEGSSTIGLACIQLNVCPQDSIAKPIDEVGPSKIPMGKAADKSCPWLVLFWQVPGTIDSTS